MILKRIFIVGQIFIFGYFCGFSQKSLNDSVFQIKGIEVSSDRFSENHTGFKTEELDSLGKKLGNNKNLLALLSGHTAVFLKSNGISGLGNVSIRGTGTSHTALLWNGFIIQNPMNGGADLSLIPVGFADKISIQYNGASSLYGSSAIGGVIHINNKPVFGQGLEASAGGTVGSFANYGTHTSFTYSGNKNYIQLRAFYNYGKNNFSYINTAKIGNPRERQSNAASEHLGVLFNESFKISPKNFMHFRLWYQQSDRQIPPLMTQENSTASQKDLSLRSMAEWAVNIEKIKFFLRTSFFNENYHYDEPEKLIFSKSTSNSSVSEAEMFYKPLPFHTLNVGINYKYVVGMCDYYKGKPDQQAAALFLAYKISNKKNLWELSASIRQEYNDNGWVSPMPALAMDVKLYDKLFLYFNISRNYRLPTLNDLYWYPGGNPDLKPEEGLAEEIGLKHEIIWNKTNLKYVFSVFNNNIDNWIIWLPASSYWSPQNIQSVWSRGAETDILLTVNLPKKNLMNTSFKISYTKSTVQKSYNQTAIGKQLIYVPEITANAAIYGVFRGYMVSYNMEYVSTRYTSADNTTGIKPYILGNVQFSKDFNLVKKLSLNVFIHLNNIWNQTYQSVAWQAMPGFNFKTGIQFSYKP